MLFIIFLTLVVGNPGSVSFGQQVILRRPRQLTTNAPKVTTKDEMYRECGHTIGCLEQPSGCINSKSCQFIVSYNKDSENRNYIKFDIVGYSRKWMAIGFSMDSNMGNDSVMECVRESGGDAVRVYLSWNSNIKGTYRSNKRLLSNNATKDILKDAKGKYFEGDIYCSFSRKTQTTMFGHVFDLVNMKFFLLTAVGSEASDGPKGNIERHDHVTVSRSSINMYETIGRTGAQRTVVKLHGVLMVVVWMILMPTGSFLARYFKETFVTKSCCGFSVWFLVHVVCMSLTLIITIGSVCFLYYYEKSFPGKKGWDFHSVVGITLMNVMVLQVPLAVGIVKFNSRYKYFFINFIHGFDGHLLFFLSYANIYQSRHKRDGLPCSTDILLIVFMVSYLIIHLVMSYHVCYTDFVQGKRVSRTYTLGPLDVPDRSNLNKDEPGTLGRKIVLGIFMLTILVFGVTLAALYVKHPDKHCEANGITTFQDHQ